MWKARRNTPWFVGLAALVAISALTGCVTTAESGAEPSTVGTVSGVGELPDFGTQPSIEAAPTTPATDVVTTDSVGADVTAPIDINGLTIGEVAKGNRVIMIGDSLTASISERYGGQACDALVPLGWQIEVDAEVSRFIDFGRTVLDKRLSAGWDAAVLFLGNNYGHDKGKYQLWLHSLLLTLYPRPTVLITTTEFEPGQEEVNQAIREEAAQFDNVTVLDWATLSTEGAYTGDDGLHLTEAGRRRLGYALAATMGEAPVQDGKCLPSDFKSGPALPTGGKSSGGTKTTTKPTQTTAKPTQTTAKPVTTPTTVKPTVTTTPSATTQPQVTPTTVPPPVTTQPAPPTTPKPPATTQPPATTPAPPGT